MNYLTEAFKALEALDEDVFSVSDDGIKKLDAFENDDEVTDDITIYDLDAETDDDLQDSYVGKVILDCNVCHSKIYSDKNDIKIDAETGDANIEDECPYCYSNEGYKIIGEVAPMATETEENVEVDNKIVEAVTKTDTAVFRKPDYSQLTRVGKRLYELYFPKYIDDANIKKSLDYIYNHIIADRHSKRIADEVVWAIANDMNHWWDKDSDEPEVQARYKDTYAKMREIEKSYERDVSDDIDKYQELVDYDWNSSHEISDQTIKAIKDAGLQLVRDKYYNYHVTAGNANEALKEVKVEDDIKESCKSEMNESKNPPEHSIDIGTRFTVVKPWEYDSYDNFTEVFDDEDDYEAAAERFIKKHPKLLKDDWIVFPKGSKFEFIWMSGIASTIKSLDYNIEIPVNLDYFEDDIDKGFFDFDDSTLSLDESLNEAVDLLTKENTIASVLSKHMDELSKYTDANSMRNAIIDILDKSEIADKDSVKKLKRVLFSKKSTGALLSTIATYMTGEKVAKVGRRDVRRKAVNENIGTDIDEYQQWVDYDMKRYGKISDQTNKEIKEAGLQVVKDKYGDYQVIAGKYDESLKESKDERQDAAIDWYVDSGTAEEEAQEFRPDSPDSWNASDDEFVERALDWFETSPYKNYQDEDEADDGVDEADDERLIIYNKRKLSSSSPIFNIANKVMQKFNISKASISAFTMNRSNNLFTPTEYDDDSKNRLLHVYFQFRTWDVKADVSESEVKNYVNKEFEDAINRGKKITPYYQEWGNTYRTEPFIVLSQEDDKFSCQYLDCSNMPDAEFSKFKEYIEKTKSDYQVIAGKYDESLNESVSDKYPIDKLFDSYTIDYDEYRNRFSSFFFSLITNINKYLQKNHSTMTLDTDYWHIYNDCEGITVYLSENPEGPEKFFEVADLINSYLKTNLPNMFKTVRNKYMDKSVDIPFSASPIQAMISLNNYLDQRNIGESLKESVKDVTITTDDSKTIMTSDDEGKVTVTTEPVEEHKDAEVIEPLTDETKVEIESDIDDIDDETLNDLGEQYLKECYNNVKCFKIVDKKVSDNSILVEGLVEFDSDNKKTTKFNFTANTCKGNKFNFLGENLNLKTGKRAFSLTGSVNNKKFIAESLRYNYKDNDGKKRGIVRYSK